MCVSICVCLYFFLLLLLLFLSAPHVSERLYRNPAAYEEVKKAD